MKNCYKILICYDGTAYKGWQRLKDDSNTIQETIELSLCKVLHEKTAVKASSRTDAGVHAFEMPAHFLTMQEIESRLFLKEINEALPDDIKIKQIVKMPPSFHSRFDALAKKYVYRIDLNEKASVFQRKYVYHFPKKLDIDAMRHAAEYMIGRHDFSSFTTDKNAEKDKIRTIYQINIEPRKNILEISYVGDGFLYNMIRIMTGTLIEIGEGKKDPEEIISLFDRKERKNAGFLAPAKGLMLEKVFYKGDIAI